MDLKTGTIERLIVDQEKEEKDASAEVSKGSVKFEVFGEEIIEKKVKRSGNSGRIYLPPEWVGHQVKIIRMN